jgi:hypothetical protein
MQNHREGVVRACRCRCPSWVPLLFVMGCLNLLVTMAHAQFTLGTGRVVSVTPLDGGCISQELPPSGTENWNIEQVFRYRVRLENVTECSGDTIHVHLFNPFRSEDDPDDCYHPQCLEATRVGDGAYEFTVRFPAPPRQGKRYFIRYCTSADCSAGGLLARRSDGGNAPSELRLSRFNQDCVWLAENKCEEPPVRCRDLDLGCLPSNDEVPDCSALAALNIETDCPAGFVLLRCENGTIEPDPNREPCGYRRQNTYIIKDLCTFQVWELQCWVFWQVDNEPPVIEPPDGGDLGCNPVPPECPIIIQQTTVTDNCPHEPPTVECQCEDRRDGCIVTRTCTITATDKCGNRSTATVVYTWNEDTEPPVVNNVPEEKLDLGCRPPEFHPNCEDLIVLLGIEAKDNCTHEPPTLHCEKEPPVEVGCLRRQVFRFWAVDKCGNRSPDYVLEVNWNVDTEPPVVNNVPEEKLDLGCRPPEFHPNCEDLIVLLGIEAKDNCTHEPPTLHCEKEPPVEVGCLRRQVFRFWAVDKCGNRSPDYVLEVNWNVDTEPPVVNNVPEEKLDLGCRPPEFHPNCEDLIVLLGIEAKDNCTHEPPTLHCEKEPPVEVGCLRRQVFRFWAVDKCGNRSPDYVLEVNWNVDTEPPVVNNVPEEKLDLGCRPPEFHPNCEDLIVLLGIEAKDNCTHEPPTLHCEKEPPVEVGCLRRQVFRFWAVDKCGNRSPDYVLEVNWNVDTEPPVVNNVPEEKLDLGCRPPEFHPNCEDLIVLLGIEAKDNCTHEPPTLHCEKEPPVEVGCLRRQVFRFWAVDKCGNRSPDYVLEVNWNVDTEPPVVNNVPETDKLPCNTRPTCDLLIARHNIHAKDNCTHEPPTLHCEPGEVVDLGNCRFRQTFTFWAEDKCGNRSRDYQLVVFWKEDTEPPVLHNVPEDRDLGCNPTHIPDCDEIRSGVYATDNCDPDVPVTCTYRDIVIGCLHIRSFILAAADECGNVTTRKVVVSWTEDTTPPIVRCPDNITVQAQFPDCLVPVTWRAKAEDDCDPRPSVACNPPSGSFFGLGTTTVTCTATDRCGNSASCQFTVTVLGYICGYKFRDNNGNGVWEPHLGEPPLAGWTIELRDQLGNVLQTTTTGPDGRFCFLGLTSPGTYVVCEVLQNGWVNTTPICRTVVLPRDCGKLLFFGNRPLTQQ